MEKGVHPSAPGVREEVYEEPVDLVRFTFAPTRREFVGALGAGLLIMALARDAEAQSRGGRGGGRGARPDVGARVHIGKDGALTVLVGKVEAGQGARAELAQAAAEELRVPPEAVSLVMADTAQVPDDGITAGSRTSPATVPAVREAAAAARGVLAATAAAAWGVEAAAVTVRGGKAVDAAGAREMGYAALAGDPQALAKPPGNVTVTEVKAWTAMGAATPRPNGRDIVTGAHRYPSDVVRPGMLYGKVLRAPGLNAKLEKVDLDRAKTLPGVVAVRDGGFVGVAAPTSFAAREALDALADTATWGQPSSVDSDKLFAHLSDRAKDKPASPFADEIGQAAKALKASYHIAYAQHAPLEPRAAVAEWDGGKLTVWTGTQNPFGVRRELAAAFRIPDDAVRVIVPDFGGGFGGKHSGECAVEAARLAREAGKPVCLRWTRDEEFTWAYFRPAAVVDVHATLGADGALTSWHFVNINGGPSALETPYKVKNRCAFVASDPPLRQGSYRGLAATGNTFARESAMDELAALAGKDPLAFRLAHLENLRLRAVLEEAARRFKWDERAKDKTTAIGLACGTEKGSFVAACAEVAVDGKQVRVTHVVQAFECGAVINPGNLRQQVEGAIMMGLGPTLREAVTVEDGVITSTGFHTYKVPRLRDVPKIDVHLLDRKDLPSAGAGETPIIAVAPAVANAVARATGQRVREMPVRLA